MPVYRLRNVCFSLIAVAVLALSASTAQAQTWVGSTGTVDPNSVNLVKYIDGKVELRNDAPVGATAFIRYNILPVRDLATDLHSIEYRVLGALLLDNGTGHAFLSLKRLNVVSGELTTLLTLDSNQAPPSASYQEVLTGGNPMFNFTFADSEGGGPDDSVYYIEVQLSRTAAGGQAGVGGIFIKKIVP